VSLFGARNVPLKTTEARWKILKKRSKIDYLVYSERVTNIFCHSSNLLDVSFLWFLQEKMDYSIYLFLLIPIFLWETTVSLILNRNFLKRKLNKHFGTFSNIVSSDAKIKPIHC